MLEDLKEDEVVKKVGGRFKLTSLIQKRMIALNAGARPLIGGPNDDRLQIVLHEIMDEKIYLDASGVLMTNEGTGDEELDEDV
jgi:RNA polymerase Rpb6.